MTVCSNCRAEQPSSDTTTCIHCGYPIVRENDIADSRPTDSSDMDFVVTEATDESRQLVGGRDEMPDRRESDDLGIETTTDLMQQEADREAFNSHSPTQSSTFGAPIGDSAPPPPPTADYSQFGFQPAQETGAQAEPEDTAGSVKKLSAEEVKKIEQNLYGSSSFLKDKEKKELEKSILEATNSSPVADEPEMMPDFGHPSAKKQSRPKKGTGIAYYYKNYVHVLGNHSLMTNDVLKVNDREYILKPKKIKPAYMASGFGAVFAVLMIIVIALFTSGSGTGQGQLVGVVLDQNDQPYLLGATVRIRERQESFQSDARGVFSAGSLPVGTYQIEYLLDDELVQVEQASITEDEVRMVFLRPQGVEESVDNTPIVKAAPVQTQQAVVQPEASAPSPPVTKSAPETKTSTTANQTTASAKSASTKSTASAKSSSATYSKVTLASNVDGARFEMDGSVLGAGNLTYSKIKPGTHRYRVESDGYNPVEGSFSVAAGDNYRLAVTLTPMNQTAKAEQYSTDDFFHSGQTAFKSGDYATAIADFGETIDRKPSHADAYYYRAQAQAALKMYREAYDDYIRAAEIYRIQKDQRQAMTCFNAAIDMDGNSVTAYLGRADLYLSRGDVLASIADYDKVVSIDNRNFQGYYGLGEARFKQQQYKKAIKHFKDARSVESENPLVHQYLVLSYLAMADDKNVKKSYEKFIEFASDDQIKNFQEDQRFSGVQRIVESH